MSIINVLDNNTINLIAAGEVVERPGSVVKELVENAMDSGANAITVEIKKGGIEFIRVTDNGSGIYKDDITLAFKRHATSKIKKADDLMFVKSMGFRGEALSSISSVAKVELITKRQDSLVGYHYEVNGGENGKIKEIGAPDGTTIIVRNLFYNIPARRKFLKSESSEANNIRDIMEHLAMARPEISFNFIVNGKTKFQTTGSSDIKEIIYRLYGKDIKNEMIPIDYVVDDIRISGYLGKPSINRSNRNFETYFINKRYIQSREISTGIEEGYREFLMQHKFPFCVLHIDMNLSEVDVNVHPAKLEVKFLNNCNIHDVVAKAVSETLFNIEMIPGVALIKSDDNLPTFEKAPEVFENIRKSLNDKSFSETSKDSALAIEKRIIQNDNKKSEEIKNIDSPIDIKETNKNNTSKDDIKNDKNDIKEENSDYKKSHGLLFSIDFQDEENQEDKTYLEVENKEQINVLKTNNEKNDNFQNYSVLNNLKNSGACNELTYDTQLDNINHDVNVGKETDIEVCKGTDNELVSGIDKDIDKDLYSESDTVIDVDIDNNIDTNIETDINTEFKYKHECKEDENEEGLVNSENEETDEKCSADSNILTEKTKPVQLSFIEEDKFLSKKSRNAYKVIGQVFNTYWIIEYGKNIFFVDQHAAHEKVNYERIMKRIRSEKSFTQYVNPPIVISLSGAENECLNSNKDYLLKIGFEWEDFGGSEIALTGIPGELYFNTPESLFMDIIEELMNSKIKGLPEVILERIATMACKASVKGGNEISLSEINELLDELLTLDNPYNCPHGRPTIFSISQTELEKKFKRIVN